MKKLGFTLAEVLITLGIIGVVAALTMPAIVNNTGNAHIGPTLQKTVATIAVANEAIMHERVISDMTDLLDDNAGNIDVYMFELSRHIAGSTYSTQQNNAVFWQNGRLRNLIPLARTNSSAGIAWQPGVTMFDDRAQDFNNSYTLFLPNNVTVVFTQIDQGELGFYNVRGSYLGTFMRMDIDINGNNSKPNTFGIDIFRFLVDRGGAVIPFGGRDYAWLIDDDNARWSTENGDNACNRNNVGTGFTCAGSIFENNLKVIYQ